MTDGGGGHILRHLDAEHVRAGGHADLGHLDRGARLRDVERAPCAQRSPAPTSVSNWRIYALQTEEERGEGGFALPLEIENSQQHHDRELYHLPRHEHVPAVFRMRSEVAGSKRHSLPQHPLLQRQQGFVRHDGLRPDTTRRDPAARIRVADRFRRRARRDRETRAPGHRGRRACEAAGRRFLQHLRRRRRSVRQLLLRGRPLAAHLSLERRDASGLDGARQRRWIR